MADSKISELPELTAPEGGDLLAIVDVSETPDVTKKITVENLLDIIYPIGSIYISVVNTSPATLFGGTWSAFGVGKTLVGLDSTDTEFDTVEETGGAKTVTLTSAQSGLPAHTHPTSNQTSNYHAQQGASGTNGHYCFHDGYKTQMTVNNNTAANAAEAHTNLQPYIVVYFFKRTA
jgi:hypothetical protein